MEEKKEYNIMDLKADEDKKFHLAEEGKAEAKEVDEETREVVVADKKKNQDIALEPQPIRAVDNDKEHEDDMGR